MRLQTARNRFTYAGRVVIITGGSRGLGLLMARQLRKEGARLVPDPAGAGGYESLPGSASRSSKLPRLVTTLGDRAAARNNELLATR